MGVHVLNLREAAQLVLTHEAKQCLAGRITERALAAAIEDLYIRSGYSDELLRQPLGKAYGFDDEWTGGWGRTDRGVTRSDALGVPGTGRAGHLSR